MLFNVTDPRERMMQYQQGSINTYAKRMPEIDPPEQEQKKTVGGALGMAVGAGYLGQQAGRSVDEIRAGQADPPPSPQPGVMPSKPAGQITTGGYEQGMNTIMPTQGALSTAQANQNAGGMQQPRQPGALQAPSNTVASQGPQKSPGLNDPTQPADPSAANSQNYQGQIYQGSKSPGLESPGNIVQDPGNKSTNDANNGGMKGGMAVGSSMGPYGMLAGAVIGLLAYYLS